MKVEDVLGIKPIGEAFSTTVTKTFEGLEGFLKSVCMPALDELGLMMRDKMRYWRLMNILNILEKSKTKLEFEGDNLRIKSHPRVALSIIENGSLNDDDEIQELWAGLFASSCTDSGKDDQNLIFVDLLKQLTVIEAKLLKYACENSSKLLHDNGLVTPGLEVLTLDLNKLIEISGINDIHRLDRELDHLRSLELIGCQGLIPTGGFSATDINLLADLTPTSLALNLYVRCQGFNGALAVYWKDTIVKYKNPRQGE